MNGQIGVAGFPSQLGGADTELDHQISVWSKMGLEIHLVHTGKELDANLRKIAIDLETRPGVKIHEPRDWKRFKGMPVISYCNDVFLKSLNDIREFASEIWWVNCMSWVFDSERDAQRAGLIDAHIYQTSRNMARIGAELGSLQEGHPWNGYLVPPYFDASRFEFCAQKHVDPEAFTFCKINREDVDKYHPSIWWLYNTMVAPQLKEGIVMGYNPERMDQKCGPPPNFVECLRAGARPVTEIYERSLALIHWADPRQTENLPRVAFEAMATGTILIGDNRGGFCDQLQDGVTGWLCSSDREFVYKASRCAFEMDERIEMAIAARDDLETNWGMEAAMNNWENFFNEQKPTN